MHPSGTRVIPMITNGKADLKGKDLRTSVGAQVIGNPKDIRSARNTRKVGRGDKRERRIYSVGKKESHRFHPRTPTYHTQCTHDRAGTHAHTHTKTDARILLTVHTHGLYAHTHTIRWKSAAGGGTKEQNVMRNRRKIKKTR